MMLRVEALSLAYGRQTVIHGVNAEINAGEFVAIIGPNGSGKSTLLKAFCRLQKPQSGTVLLENQDIWSLPLQRLAQSVALVRQESSAAFDFTVEELVMLGRIPYLRRFQSETAADRQIVEHFLELTGTADLRKRHLLQLSGGERQRVFIAQALAQEPRLLLLDEPTNHLDINHQLETLDLVRQLNAQQGITVVTVLHDLNLAALYAERLLVLHEGRLIEDGSPERVLRPELIEQVYGCPVNVLAHPETGRPQVLLRPRL